MRRMVVGAVVLVVVGLTAPNAQAGSPRVCEPVVNPYAGTRYEGVDLRRIRAVGVSCRIARRVAKYAHREALGMTPPASGIRRFSWHRWRVTGDLRPATDRYRATRDGMTVRWVF